MLERGAEIAGNSSAVAAGAMLGGGEGAVAGLVGAALAPMVTQLSEFGMRTLGRREESRTSAVIIYACDVLREFEKQGFGVRDDGFFAATEDDRSDGEEIVEAVMKAAQVSYEERKLRHLGNLLGLLAVDVSLDRGTANWLIRTAEELSWTQYVLLAMVPAPDSDDEPLPKGDILSSLSDWNSWTVERELADLGYGKRELVRWGHRRTENLSLRVPLGDMSSMRLAQGGLLLHNGLGLGDVSTSEQDRIRGLLIHAAPSSSADGPEEPPTDGGT
ncbi:hypothetical protein [Terrabacter sp. RAF57]|uniref:hypothetical protein n=1 Tax=Terrabacter sp. RAF57 TaxID=3233063 RepID=UPI003F9C0616